MAKIPGFDHREARKTGENGFSRGQARLTEVLKTGQDLKTATEYAPCLHIHSINAFGGILDANIFPHQVRP